MRSTRIFLKVSSVVIVATILAMGSLSGVSARIGQTAPATGTPGASSAGGASAATSSAATGSTATMNFTPCSPENILAGTAVATSGLTTPGTPQVATTQAASGTLPPTMAATVNPNPAYLGVQAEQVDSCGSSIIAVIANSPASKAQLQAGDVIVAFNGTPEPTLKGIRDAVQNSQPGDIVTLTIQRNGQQMDVKVTLGTKPPDNTGSITVVPGAGTAAPTVPAVVPTQQATS